MRFYARQAPSASKRSRLIAVVAAALVIAAVALAGWWIATPGADPIYVAALPPVFDGSPDAQALDLAAAVELAGQRALLALEGISLLSPEQVETSLAESAIPGEAPAPGPRRLAPQRTAAILGVDELISYRLDCRRESCEVRFARIDGAKGLLLFSHRLEMSASDPLLAETALGGVFEMAFSERRWRRGRPVLKVESEDYDHFLRLRRSYLRGAAGTDGGLGVLAELEAMVERSPAFVDAVLLAARIARQRFFDSRSAADLRRARGLARRAQELAPEDARAWLAIVDIETEADDLPSARRGLEVLEGLQPGHVDVAIRRAFVLQREGEMARALELMRRAVSSKPSTRRLFDLANLELRMGAAGPARESLTRLLERDPDSYAGRALLAELELMHGGAERATELWAELAARHPSFANLSNLGLALLLAGDYEGAARRFTAATERAPSNAAAWLNLADVTWLAGRRERAVELYGRALELAEADPDPEHWAQLLVRTQALARRGQPSEAMAVLQRALQKAPGNPEVAFVAALVHSIAGEWASAEAHARRALDLGVAPRWFFFPEFDVLRRPGGPLPPGAVNLPLDGAD